MWTSTDRWSCPYCPSTTVIDGSPEDTAVAIEAVQRRHGKLHQKAREEERVARWVAKMRRDMGIVTPPGKLSA
jgi:hypothetical protein